MKKFYAIFVALFMFVSGGTAHAADSACARVSIEILQELTLERVAFDAKLLIHNNLPDQDLQNVRVDVTIQDAEGNVKNDIFFTRVSSLDNIDGVAGDGTVYRNTTSEAHWLIIPSPGAGGEDPAGVPYFVGATLSYTLNGEQEILPINPDRITVRPTAQLYLDYFMPYAVLGDNPFTSQTEAPVPYPLAVRVLNDGFGPANKLKIDSAQPKIVDNQQGLLVDFKLLGAAVNDSAISPSLTVDMGNVDSKDAATGYWEMISTLSGRFIEFDVSFTHASELGGELTSLIKETNAHYLTRRVLVNLPGRDGLLDFLADTDQDDEHLPDAIFESEIPAGGSDRSDALAPVTVVPLATRPARPTPEAPEVSLTLDLSASPLGWTYARTPDPSQGLLKLLEVVRDDGVHLDPHNFWVEEGLDQDYKTIHTLQFIDYRAARSTPGGYTLVYTEPDEDLLPPSTTLIFDGPAVEGETTYLTPQTRIVLAARDREGGSGVAEMFRKVQGQDDAFLPAFPFTLAEAGSYALDFYSVDNAGNVESVKTRDLVVDDAAPQVGDSFVVAPAAFSPLAPDGVAAQRTTTFSFTASDDVPELPFAIEIFDGSGRVVRTLRGTAPSGISFSIDWSGNSEEGQPVPAGEYSAALKVTDGLEETDGSAHTATAETTVTVEEWYGGVPVDPFPGAQQMQVALSGTRAVWQDDRNGHWDIYTKDLTNLAVASLRLTADGGAQQAPAVDGDLVVWQDDRNGDWDLYGYNLGTGQEFSVVEAGGHQQNPALSGDWVAWQDDRAGNQDIWAKNLSTGEVRQITNHERDQIRPALSGTLLAWEDYRHGLGEIYTLDLAGGEETRVTFDLANQILPVFSNSTLVWTDQRDGQKEIYTTGTRGEALRLTYGEGDRSQPAIFGSLLVYTDFSRGTGDSNLAFLDLAADQGGRLTTDPSRQEEPAAGEGWVAWQDERDGTWQIYATPLETVGDTTVRHPLRQGFNLLAVGQSLVDRYGSAAALLTAPPEGVMLERAMSYSAPHGQFFDADLSGGDFALSAGASLVLYAAESGELEVAAVGEDHAWTLLPGTNHIGMLSVPFGYRAYDLIRALGLEKVQSVRRYDGTTGLWQSAAVREGEAGPEIVGMNFPVEAGEGLVITMKERVDGWKP